MNILSQIETISKLPFLSSSLDAAFNRLINFEEGPFPKDDVQVVIQNYEHFRERLLAVVERVSGDLNTALEENNWFIQTFAIFLLAHRREKALFPLIIRILHSPWESVDAFLGDGLTEDLARQLASVYDGDAQALETIAVNSALDPFLRTAMIETFLVLYRNNIIDRNFLVRQFERLFERFAGDIEYAHFALARVSVEAYIEELFPQVRRVFEHELAEFDRRETKYVLNKIDRPREEILARFYENRHLRLMSDPVEEMSTWHCFREDKDDDSLDFDDFIDDPRCPDCGSFHHEEVREPYVRLSPKIGRNEPCSCGSGKKFKKCCGN